MKFIQNTSPMSVFQHIIYDQGWEKAFFLLLLYYYYDYDHDYNYYYNHFIIIKTILPSTATDLNINK